MSQTSIFSGLNHRKNPLTEWGGQAWPCGTEKGEFIARAVGGRKFSTAHSTTALVADTFRLGVSRTYGIESRGRFPLASLLGRRKSAGGDSCPPVAPMPHEGLFTTATMRKHSCSKVQIPRGRLTGAMALLERWLDRRRKLRLNGHHRIFCTLNGEAVKRSIDFSGVGTIAGPRRNGELLIQMVGGYRGHMCPRALSSDPSFPKSWPRVARAAVLHALSLASTAIAGVRGRAVGSRRRQVRYTDSCTNAAPSPAQGAGWNFQQRQPPPIRTKTPC